MTFSKCDDFVLPVYQRGSVKKVARVRDISRRAASDPEGGLETETHPDSQGVTETLLAAATVTVSEHSLFSMKFLLTPRPRWVPGFQEGSITQVACCPHDEDFIAVATRLVCP